MATNGPTKISAEEVKKFNAMLRLPAGAERLQKQKELSPEENVKFVKYVSLLKEKQKLKKLEEKDAVLAARQEELLTTLQSQQALAETMKVQMQEAEDKLKALQLEQSELVRQDQAILTQASTKFAQSLDALTKNKPAAKSTVIPSTTKPNY